MIQRILVVCVGNICRSPTAEILLRREVPRAGLLVESAGLAALTGAGIDPRAAEVLAAHGLDPSGHVARQVTPAMIDGADLVIAMEKRHLAALHAIAPHARGKAHLLGRWEGDLEVRDPYRQPREAFGETYAVIERLVAGWRRRL